MIDSFIHWLRTSFCGRLFNHYEIKYLKKSFGLCDSSVDIRVPMKCTAPHKVFLGHNVNIFGGATILINPKGEDGRFIVKKNTGIAQNVTVVTNSHTRIKGHFFKEYSGSHMNDVDKDIVIEEDVWIGTGVTLLPGVVVGRGSNIGAGAVIRSSIPPYAIVTGNPAKIVGFIFTPEEIIEHEKTLYHENERFPLELLESNYDKFFLKRLKEIKEYRRL